MCKDENVRIVIKQGSGVPTVPVSADHRNGDWIATDIYEGEQYQDTDTGIVYTRSSTGIEAVGGGGGAIQPKVWKAQIAQSATDAPYLNVLENTLGVTVVPSYSSVGTYLLSGFDSKLTDDTCTSMVVSLVNDDDYYTWGRISTSIISIITSNAGVLADDVLDLGRWRESTITVTKYD
jgi:hypothetical protein